MFLLFFPTNSLRIFPDKKGGISYALDHHVFGFRSGGFPGCAIEGR